jgi:hypothetical protein
MNAMPIHRSKQKGHRAVNNKDKPRPGKDPFGLPEMWDSVEPFHYSAEAWAAVEEWAAKYSLEVNNARIPFEAGTTELVPLRAALEVTIHNYLCQQAFRDRYPPLTRNQIAEGLKNTTEAVRRLRCNPLVGTYGADLGAPQVLKALQERLRKIGAAIEKGAPLPGTVAPKDDLVVEGWQRHHRDLSRDPDEKLIFRLCELYQQAFGREVADADTGASVEFIRTTARPVLHLSHSIRGSIRKFKTGRA